MNIENKKINFRYYQAGDEKDVCDLLIKIFKVKKKLRNKMRSAWHWKYPKSPYGFKSAIALNNKNEIIGHDGLIIKRVLISGQETYNYQGGDTFIENDYRGQNFIYQLIDFYSTGTNMSTWGFPNTMATHVYLKPELSRFLDTLFQVSILEKKVSFLKLFINKKIKTDITIEKFNNQIDLINGLWNKKRPELNQAAVRDWAFLKWRIIDSPENNQLFLIKKNNLLIGYLAIKKRWFSVSITDILVLNNEINNNLMEIIDNFLVALGIKKIQILINDEQISKCLLTNNYYLKENKNFVCFDEHRKSKKSDFYLTFADSDFYL